MEPQVVLVLLLLPALLCKPFRRLFFVPLDTLDQPLNMSWSKAQARCLSRSSDLLTLDVVSSVKLSSITEGLEEVWMGLHRDALNDSAWLWVNTTTIEPTPGDVSQSLNWTAEGFGPHCALHNSDSTWSSRRCDELQPFFCSSLNGQQHYKDQLSWHDAREYCLNISEQLVSIFSKNDATAQTGVLGWIGLYRVGGDTWAWAGGENVSYTAWGPGEPATSDCAAFSVQEQRWKSSSCDAPLQVVCYSDTLEVVTQKKTWEEALEHCKGLGLQLLVIRKIKDHYNYVRKRIYQADTDQVWVGLRFLAGRWWWLDEHPVEEELPLCPQHTHNCGVMSKTDPTSGLTDDCSRRLSFVCYRPHVTEDLIL